MSLYKAELPKVFPYAVKGPAAEIREMVEQLLSPARTDVPDGSSFAITADAYDGQLWLWMSSVSFKYLDRRRHFHSRRDAIHSSQVGGFGE